jgi:hypothetical protein
MQDDAIDDHPANGRSRPAAAAKPGDRRWSTMPAPHAKVVVGLDVRNGHP